MRAIGDPGLAARLSRREDLPGIAETMRIERLAQLAHEAQVRLGEDERHVVDLLEADTVLPGDGAAHGRAHFQDLSARPPIAWQLVPRGCRFRPTFCQDLWRYHSKSKVNSEGK